MDLEFYWDDAGDPRARAPRAAEKVHEEGTARQAGAARLAAFLESDVQGSDVFAREILEGVERVASGDLDGWESTGNAHTLTVNRSGALLEAELEEDAEPCRLSHEELREALAGWLELLEGRG